MPFFWRREAQNMALGATLVDAHRAVSGSALGCVFAGCPQHCSQASVTRSCSAQTLPLQHNPTPVLEVADR